MGFELWINGLELWVELRLSVMRNRRWLHHERVIEKQKEAPRTITRGFHMDLSGLEPLTPWLQTRCSPS